MRVSQNLQEIRKLVEADGARFKVVLFPLMRPLKDYDQGEKWSRDHALAITKALHLDTIDLAPALEEILPQNKQVEESKGDYWHPNQWAADHLGKYLYDQGLFKET